jgi:adenine-specific DNA-methyltransferase
MPITASGGAIGRQQSAANIKRFLSEVKHGRVPQTLLVLQDVGSTQDAKKTLLEMGVLKAAKTTCSMTPKPWR